MCTKSISYNFGDYLSVQCLLTEWLPEKHHRCHRPVPRSSWFYCPRKGARAWGRKTKQKQRNAIVKERVIFMESGSRFEDNGTVNDNSGVVECIRRTLHFPILRDNFPTENSYM